MKLIFAVLDFFHSILRAIGSFFRILLRGVLWLLSPLLWCVAGVSGFVARWVNSRDARFLIEGAPALLVVLGVSASVFAAWLPTRRNQAATYLKQAFQYYENGDQATARLLVQKAAASTQGSQLMEFKRAEVMEQIGLVDEAFAVIARLAPVSEPGYLAAHVWIADKLTELNDGRSMELLDKHIEHILELSPNHPGVHRFLGIQCIKRKQFRKALYHLSRAVDKTPKLHLTYAQLLRAGGFTTHAIAEAKKAKAYYDERITLKDLEEQEREEVVIGRSAALVLLGEFNEAVMTLRGDEVNQESERIRNMLGATYVAWSDSIPPKDMQHIAQKMNMLNLALELAPEAPEVIRRIGVLASQEGPIAEKADKLLKELLAAGKAPAIVHFILGTRAAEQGDHPVAVMHLEQAVKSNGKVTSTLNNLAWVLANRDEPDLERAMAYANRAINLNSESATYHETRGQIHVKLGNWTDAIQDLEFVLKNRKLSTPEVHDGLALAYQNVGDLELARIHERNAATVRKRLNGDENAAQETLTEEEKTALDADAAKKYSSEIDSATESNAPEAAPTPTTGGGSQ